MKAHPLQPGSTIGIFGSGQLGAMLTQSAQSLGYRVFVYSPEADSPAAEIADQHFCAEYDHLEQVTAFINQVDVATFEFENIPADTISTAAKLKPIYPNSQSLYITQHRIREKTFLHEHAFPVAPFAVINSLADLTQAVAEIGMPSVLKTAAFGYDGKGQAKIMSDDQAGDAWQQIGAQPAVLEKWINFETEISVIVARDQQGQVVAFTPGENHHHRQILDLTIVPATVSPRVLQEAQFIASEIVSRLDYVGVMGVEMFVLADQSIMINELAPRVHNSGHHTIEACTTSQFEQHIRAITGLPLGSVHLHQPACMANLLGDVWFANGQLAEPNWASALSDPRIKLHLYRKREPRLARKMGHLTMTAATVEEAKEAVLTARQRLIAHLES